MLGGLAAIFAISLIPLAGITRDRRPHVEPGARASSEALEGFRVVGRHPEVRELLGVLSALTLVEGATDALIVVAALSFLDREIVEPGDWPLPPEDRRTGQAEPASDHPGGLAALRLGVGRRRRLRRAS